MTVSPLEIARAELRGRQAWLVGGAVRDDLLGRTPVDQALDVDIAIAGSAGEAARALRKACGPGVAAFELSDQYGGWRVAGGDWQVDLIPLQGETLEEDLMGRDLTVNAIARPLDGGPEIDPSGGVADLRAGLLRMVGAEAFTDDPLRVLRLARLSSQLQMAIEDETVLAARESASGLDRVASERVFAELSAILASSAPEAGMATVADLGAEAVVLPELAALRGVEQTRYHHLDAHGHTLEVLQRAAELEADPSVVAGERAAEVADILAEPLADGLSRGVALRWAALLHDIAKPQTRAVSPEGRVGFPGHDREGAAMAREILGRLRASDRLASYVAAITETHLLLGFLVHRQPLSAADFYDYLDACDPVEVDVTLLSVADRLATRGRKADESIAAHMEVAQPVMSAALDWRRDGRPAAQLPGDELAAELGIEPGPRLGELLAGIERASYAGDVSGREEAVAWARESLKSG